MMQPVLSVRQIIKLDTGEVRMWVGDFPPEGGWQFHEPPGNPWTPCDDCPGLGHCAQAGGCLRSTLLKT